MCLAHQPLQRPTATFLDLLGIRWQWHDPADVINISLVGETGHVMFDTVVPVYQRGGAREADRPIWREQAATGGGGCGLDGQKKQREGRGRELQRRPREYGE